MSVGSIYGTYIAPHISAGAGILLDFMPIWLPILLFVLFLEVWVRYIQTRFIADQGYVLLEIKLPREIRKTPLAMEIFLTALYQFAKGDYISTYLVGKMRPWFSLELVSIDGQVHFFVWTQPRFKNLVESQIYAQYPEVEVYEVEDYALPVKFDTETMSMFGLQFKLSQPDPYPIKTYIDYGMDKNPDEEEKTDPMTSVLEFLGSLKKGQQAWIQILIRAHRKEGLKDVRLRKKEDWKKDAEKEIQKIRDGLKVKGEKGEYERRPTKGEEEKITALERSISKFPFDTCIRAIYLGSKEAFDGTNIAGLLGTFRQYNSNTLNGFGFSKLTAFDYPWQDFRGTRLNTRKRKLLDAYKRRSYFYPPYSNFWQKPFILNTEELATIYHFPGGVAATPTLLKSGSKKAEAPVNLPV